jgi:hypothetical protein
MILGQTNGDDSSGVGKRLQFMIKYLFKLMYAVSYTFQTHMRTTKNGARKHNIGYIKCGLTAKNENIATK